MRSVAIDLVLGALCQSGCGRVAFDRVPGGTIGDSAMIDVADANLVTLLPFGPAVELDTISQSTEDDPTLTGDLLEIIFESTRAGGVGMADLWWSSRATPTAPWAPAVVLTALCSTAGDEHPGLSDDGLTIWFASRRPGSTGGHDIWTSTRPARGSTAWTTPVIDTGLSTSVNNEAPQIAYDGLTMMLASGPDGTDEDVQIATRATTDGPWSTPVKVDAVDVNAIGITDSSPALSGDLLTLYYSSHRLGGVPNLYRARRTGPTEPFGPVEQLTELGTDGSDPWISPDERTLVFQRGGRLYAATR